VLVLLHEPAGRQRLRLPAALSRPRCPDPLASYPGRGGVLMGGGLLQAARVRDAAGSPLGCRVCRLQPGECGRGTSNIVDPFVKSKKGSLRRYPFLHFSGDLRPEEMCEQRHTSLPCSSTSLLSYNNFSPFNA
jgi:hypothetical protein